MKFTKTKKRWIAFFSAIVMFFITIMPHITKAITIPEEMYNSTYVEPSWNPTKYTADGTGYISSLIPTGLAFNWTTYNKVGNWPFMAQAYLSERPGHLNSEFTDFNNRFIYCVANHVQNYRINPGSQAFFDHRYTTEDMFPQANKGADPKFNFLMLAIACNYPGSEYNPESKADIAMGLTAQVIAWLATDDNRPGFSRNFAADLAYFRSSDVYDALMNSFVQEPEINNVLHSAPAAGTGAAAAGMTNNAEGYFYDIWTAANLSRNLTPDWDKMISTFNTQAVQENGEYHVYIDLFATPEAQIYLNGIGYTLYGDWTFVDQTNNIIHLKSPTGETDENGSICTLQWDPNKIGALMPVDMSKAKLFTFTFFNDNLQDPNDFRFFNGQTYFSSVIESGLNLYVTLGEKQPEPGDGEVHVDRYEHEENFSAAYNVNLRKYDAETGKPLADSHWDILESFDDSQLDETNLDLLEVGEYTSNIGSLNNTSWEDGDDIETNYNGDTGLNESEANLYNWKNDDGTQFDKWTDPYDDPCLRDDNVTGDDGLLYEISSDGSASSFSNCKTYVCMIK